MLRMSAWGLVSAPVIHTWCVALRARCLRHARRARHAAKLAGTQVQHVESRHTHAGIAWQPTEVAGGPSILRALDDDVVLHGLGHPRAQEPRADHSQAAVASVAHDPPRLHGLAHRQSDHVSSTSAPAHTHPVCCALVCFTADASLARQFIPVRFNLLFNGSVACLWNTYLCWADAHNLQSGELELDDAADNATAAPVAAGAAVQHVPSTPSSTEPSTGSSHR